MREAMAKRLEQNQENERKKAEDEVKRKEFLKKEKAKLENKFQETKKLKADTTFVKDIKEKVWKEKEDAVWGNVFKKIQVHKKKRDTVKGDENDEKAVEEGEKGEKGS